MEEKNKLQNAIAAVMGTSSLVGSPLPSSFVQLPQSAVLPLGTFPSIGGIVPAPSLSHPFLSALQQQPISLQEEPVLLLPAAALPQSTNLGASASLFCSSKGQPTPFQYNQQLFLNNGQVPLLLNSSVSQVPLGQPFQTPHTSQSIIVLPIGKSSEDLKPRLECNGKSDMTPKHNKESEECQNSSHLKEAGEHSKHLENDTVLKKSTSNDNFTKARNRRKKDMVTDGHDATGNVGSKTEESANISSNNDKNLDIAQIISKLPSGWQVVGITGLNQLESVIPAVPTLPTLSYSSSETGDTSCHLKNFLLTTEIKHTPSDQPSLVSVNLNSASIPFASETVLDESSADRLTCSVKLDDIPCTHVISVKTECLSNPTEDKSNDRVTEVQSNDKHMNEDLTDPCVKGPDIYKQLQNLKTEKSSEANGQETEASGSEKCTLTLPHLIQTEGNYNWAVIGVTALPSTINTATASYAGAASSSLQVSGKSGNPTLASKSPTTILKIPVCTTAASSALLGDKKSLQQDDVKSSSVASLVPCQSKTNTETSAKLLHEDEKWTIVGVLGAPLNGSSTHFHDAAQTNIPSISVESDSPNVLQAIASPSSLKGSAANMLSNNLLNILPPHSGVGSFLSSPSQPSSHKSSPEVVVGRQKIKSRKSLSPSHRKSPGTDDLFQSSAKSESEQISQWKIIGVTPLGIPEGPSSPLVSLSQLSSFPSAIPVPFIVSEPSAPSFTSITTKATHIVSATSSTLSAPSSLQSTSLPSTSCSSFPVFTMAGNASSTSMILTASSPVLASPSAPQIQTLQDLVHQQNFGQLIQSQLATYQNSVTPLALGEPDQWNVIGFIANNQVSVLSPSPNTSALSNSAALIPTLPDSLPVTVSGDKNPSMKSKANLVSSETPQKSIDDTSQKSTTVRQSLASKLRSVESEGKSYHIKSKDVRSKQIHARLKKNTVSNLLKMKRMQQRTYDNGSSEDGDQSFDELQDYPQQCSEVPPKKAKTRSLRSYAGNRKLFMKSQNKDANDKIRLRSGTQVPHYKSDESEVAEASPVCVRNEDVEPQLSEQEIPEKVKKDSRESPVMKAESHSSARRRKLKVPRKMVADLDYHPFDSSSDSN